MFDRTITRSGQKVGLRFIRARKLQKRVPETCRRVPHAAQGLATVHGKVGPSRDRPGAVEAIGRVCPSLTVGDRISAIFVGAMIKILLVDDHVVVRMV